MYMWGDDYTKDEPDDSAGYADPLSDGVSAFVCAVIIAAVGYLAWVFRAGMLLVWG